MVFGELYYHLPNQKVAMHIVSKKVWQMDIQP